MTKEQNPKRKPQNVPSFGHWDFGFLDLFWISDFGFGHATLRRAPAKMPWCIFDFP
jgi:hypothetical protein